MCRIAEKSIDTARGSIVVKLQDCFGHMTIIDLALEAENCPHCGRPLPQADGELDLDKLIEDELAGMHARVERLCSKGSRHGFDMEKMKSGRDHDQASAGERSGNAQPDHGRDEKL
jgi:hypothetical protein